MKAQGLSIRLLVTVVSSLPCYSAAISASVNLASGPANSITQPGTISLSATAPIGGFSATATVNWGSYSLNANANCGGTTVCGALGNADFSDSITILDKSGILRALSGISTSLDNGDGVANSHFTFGSFSAQLLSFTYLGDICPCSQAFSAGQAIKFTGGGNVNSQDSAPGDPNLGAEKNGAGVAFSFTVLDVNGQPLTGFHYTSDSDHDYGLTGGIFVAPEPTAIGCVIGGLVALVLLGGRRVRLQFAPLRSAGQVR
jgi:hypothetical protein